MESGNRLDVATPAVSPRHPRSPYFASACVRLSRLGMYPPSIPTTGGMATSRLVGRSP